MIRPPANDNRISVPVPIDKERRRRAAAERQRLSYRRRVLGFGVFKLILRKHPVVDALIELGWLDEDASADDAVVESALAEFVEEMLTREGNTRRG